MTKQDIIDLLMSNDRAVGRALMALNERQTADEQASENTRYDNGRGFRPCHARMGTSMAKFFLRFNRLSDKQVAYWRRPMKDGKPRITIYAGQLLEVAQQRERSRRALSEREMQAMEAAADREETRRDEHNKFLARCRMERV